MQSQKLDLAFLRKLYFPRNLRPFSKLGLYDNFPMSLSDEITGLLRLRKFRAFYDLNFTIIFRGNSEVTEVSDVFPTSYVQQCKVIIPLACISSHGHYTSSEYGVRVVQSNTLCRLPHAHFDKENAIDDSTNFYDTVLIGVE